MTIGIGALLFSIYLAFVLYSRLSRSIDSTVFCSNWPRRFPILYDLIPIAILAGVSTWLLLPCLKGHMPFSWDHPVHLLRFWDFTQMLEKGKLTGWSDIWNQGYPLGEAYPPGSNWWCGLFYVITFGRLSHEATYSIAFLFFYALIGISVYHLGKTFFNRSVGFIAGLISLLDIGSWRQGGYDYIVNIGVWTQGLGTVFALFAFSYLFRVLKRGKRLDFVFCAIFLGVSVLCHPMCLVYYCICLPVFYLVFAVAGRDKSFVVLSALAIIVGVMLSLFWLFPFVTKSHWFVSDGGLKWRGLVTLVTRVLEGTLFPKTWPFLTWFGLFGGIISLRQRNLRGVFLFFSAGLLLVFGAKDLFYELDYPGISSGFKNLIYERVSIPIKLFLFILAAFSLYTAFRTKPSHSPTPRYMLVIGLLLVLVAAPLLKPLGQSLTEYNQIEGRQLLGRINTKHKLKHWKDFQAYVKWLNEEKKTASGFFRVAYEGKVEDHFFASAPVYTGVPGYKDGTSPAPPFQGRPKYNIPESQDWLSIKYVVNVGKLKRKSLELEKRFGSIYVYRNPRYSPRRYTLEGPGKVKVLRFDAERIKLSITGTSAESRIVIHRGNFENWRATHNGKPLPISSKVLDEEVKAISIAAKDGSIEIRYTRPWNNVVGITLSWTAVAILLLVGVAPYIRRLRTFTWLERIQRLAVRW